MKMYVQFTTVQQKSFKIHTILEHKGVELLIQHSNSPYSAVELNSAYCRQSDCSNLRIWPRSEL